VDLLRSVNTAVFGAITSKPVKAAEAELHPALRGTGLVYRSPIVRMRQLFDLYVCLRPCKAYPGNPLNFKERIDLVVFRENTEDLYAGVEFNPVPRELAVTLRQLSKPFGRFAGLPPEEVAVSCKINTRAASERIVRAAFDFARRQGRRKVTIVHKANVVRAADGLFLDAARDVARGYPGIEADEANVDAITMWLLKNPMNYDVLVAPNLYGDIISDLCAQMVGGLGFGCSANIGERLAVFEPTHGSAPKYAGQRKVNPIATILSLVMMLDWLGETERSARLERAVAAVLADGRVRTYDMGGAHSTMEMAAAIAAAIPAAAVAT
jgi:3-isopropylmalate dehydrogenase